VNCRVEPVGTDVDIGHDRTTMRRVLPSPAEDVTVRDAYDVERPSSIDGRPWLGLCMVTSIDGSTAVEGRSGGLSNDHDREVLRTLRQLADVIVVGAGTVRDEGYGPPSKPGQRVGVVTSSGRIDTSTSLFSSGAGFVITTTSAPDPGVDVVRAGNGQVDLVDAVGRLNTIVPDVAFVQVEGGPRLNASLYELDLFDELNITTSPRLVGGRGPRPVSGAAEGSLRYELAHLLVDDDSFVFSRWVRRRAC
jgi:riboflavin biosynthesis pyrimidine reductase